MTSFDPYWRLARECERREKRLSRKELKEPCFNCRGRKYLKVEGNLFECTVCAPEKKRERKSP